MSRATDFNLNRGLLLSLPMFEGVGTVSVKDTAAPHHQMTLVHSPAWVQLLSGLWVMSFTGTHPDYIRCLAASSTDLNLLAGSTSVYDFSIAFWFYHTGSNEYFFMSRGYQRGGTGGWGVRFAQPRYYNLMHSDGGQTGISNSTLLNAWHLLAFSRSGASTWMYVDGLEPSTYFVHDTVYGYTATQNFCIGAQDHGETIDYAYTGYMWNPRIWNRVLLPYEHMQIFNTERMFFGV